MYRHDQSCKSVNKVPAILTARASGTVILVMSMHVGSWIIGSNVLYNSSTHVVSPALANQDQMPSLVLLLLSKISTSTIPLHHAGMPCNAACNYRMHGL